MLEGGNLRWDRAQHCLTEGSLRSPVGCGGGRVRVFSFFGTINAACPPTPPGGGGGSAVTGGRILPSYSKESFRFP